jgi:hypothetical protein
MDAAGYITPEEVRLALQKVHSEGIETNLEKALRHALAGDLKPVDERGRWKPSSLVILVGVIVSALLGVFLYFSVGMSR